MQLAREAAERCEKIDAGIAICVRALERLGVSPDVTKNPPVPSSELESLEAESEISLPPLVRAILVVHGGWYVDYEFVRKRSSGIRQPDALSEHLFAGIEHLASGNSVIAPTHVHLSFGGSSDLGPFGKSLTRRYHRWTGDYLYLQPDEKRLLSDCHRMDEVFDVARSSALVAWRAKTAAQRCARVFFSAEVDDVIAVDGALEGEPVLWFGDETRVAPNDTEVLAENALAFMELFAATGLMQFWTAGAYKRTREDLGTPIWAAVPQDLRPPVRRWLDLLGIRDEIVELFPGVP